ncbi:MAG: hypothetical protein IJT00_10590 [Lachnospiraceae bacterium]|nr:hypothetical protein [Lachnospiraceae bacterium]
MGVVGKDGKAVPITDPEDKYFTKDRSYAVIFDLTLAPGAADCYELGETVFLVTVGAMKTAMMNFTFKGIMGSTGLVKDYDGKAVTPQEILSTVTDSKLVTYGDDEKTVVIIDDVVAAIDTDPRLKAYWVRSDKKTPLSSGAASETAVNPTAAGTYFYRIVFTDDSGTYRSVSEYIKLVIKPISAVVRPVLASEGDAVVNEFVTASEVLKNVSYSLINASGEDITGSIDKKYFWGVAYNYDLEMNATQSYEPIFKIQEIKKKEGEDPVIRDLAGNEKLICDPEVSYRIVFSGNKGIFNQNGFPVNICGINETSLKIEENSYLIEVSDDTLYKDENVVKLTLKAAKPTTIDVSAIVEGKAAALPQGGLFSKPLESEYTREPLYTKKADYKNAVVKAGGDTVDTTGSGLVYSWEMFNNNRTTAELYEQEIEYRLDAFLDDDCMVFDPPETKPAEPGPEAGAEEWEAYRKQIAAFTVWNDNAFNDWKGDLEYTWDGIDSEIVRSEDGTETTHSFNDSGSSWAAPSNPGIYRLRIEFTDPSHEYADSTAFVYYVIHKIKAAAELIGAPVAYTDGNTSARDVLTFLQGTDPGKTDTYVKTAFRYVGPKGPGEELKIPDDLRLRIASTPGDYLKVQRQIVVDGETQWETCSDSYLIKETETYRLMFDLPDISVSSGYLWKYVNLYGNGTGSHDQPLRKSGKVDGMGTIPLTVRASEKVPVYITVDDSGFSYEKVYDGNGIDLSTLKVKVKEADTEKEVDLPIVCRIHWVDEEYNYNDPAFAIHAGDYHITLYTMATEKYAPAMYPLADELKEYRITKRPLTLRPVLKTPVLAGALLDGSSYSGYCNAIKNNVVEKWEIAYPPVEGDVNVFDPDNALDYPLVFLSGVKQTPEYENRYRGYLTSRDEFYVTLDEENINESTYEFGTRTDAAGYSVNYSTDYEIKAVPTAFTPARNHALVDGDQGFPVTVSYTHPEGVYEWTDTITAGTGIPVDQGSKKHLVHFKVTKPDEFRQYGDEEGRNKSFNDFAFRESIRKAVTEYGGDPENEGVTNVDEDSINVTMNADLILKTEGGKAAFDIVWDVAGNYAEHFVVDLSGATLYDDLSEAVAPAGITLAAGSKKMAVGDTQQLDVKVKKKQNSDVILLAYESDHPDVISVTGGPDDIQKTDDYRKIGFTGAGFVTALKPGAATITAYPCKEVYDPESGTTTKTRIEGKPAAIKITVTEVETTKPGKITSHDTSVTFTYKMPANGFRREFYVLKGKAGPAEFEKKISEVKNGDYSAFDAVRIGATEQSFDKKTGQYVNALPKSVVSFDGQTGHLMALYGLQPETQYTLYIRNVSGIRNLDDGAVVAASAAGGVKPFKTSKTEPDELSLSVREGDSEAVSNSDPYNYYLVKFSKKKVQIEVSGKFRDTSAGADIGDYVKKLLPLKGAEGKAVQKQKLQFVVMDDDAIVFEPNKVPPKADKKNYACYKDGNGDTVYYEKTDIAAINNKGVLTLRGQGIVKVLVIDKVSGTEGTVGVFIDADPDSVAVSKKASKNLVLQPSGSVWLSSLLEYKEGKTVIASYQGYSKVINNSNTYVPLFSDLTVAESSDDSFRIERKSFNSIRAWDHGINGMSVTETHDYLITPLKSGASKTLTVSDSAVAGKTVNVNLTTAAIEPVKQITAVWKDPVTEENIGLLKDDGIYGFFTHSPNGVSADVPRTEESDADHPGKLKAKLTVYDMNNRIVSSEARVYYPLFFDARKKVWVYFWGEEGPIKGLTPKQQYKIGIRVLDNNGTGESTETFFLVKTTDLAASHTDLSRAFIGYAQSPYMDKPAFNFYRLDEHIGGVDYNISEGANYGDKADASSKLSQGPVLTTGNTYTLTPVLGDGSSLTVLSYDERERPNRPETPMGNGEEEIPAEAYGDTGSAEATVNTQSNGRIADKLTWKVKDKKIVKIKANKGTYNATLTALKPGVTEVELISKITKKVIMRRKVVVGAVTDGRSYYGTNEPYNLSRNWGYSYAAPESTTIDRDILEITLDHHILVTLPPRSTQWFVFEAPAFGEYDFKWSGSTQMTQILEQGQLIYFRVSNLNMVSDYTYTVSVSGTIYDPVSGDSFTMRAGSGTPVVFYPVDDENYYTFSFTDDNGNTRYLSGFARSSILTPVTALPETGDGGYAAIAISNSAFETRSAGYEKQGIGLMKGDELRIFLSENSGVTKGREYRITVTKVVPDDTLTTEKEVNYNITNPVDGENEERYYKFTASENGIYSFTMKGEDGSAPVDWYVTRTIMTPGSDVNDRCVKNEGTQLFEFNVSEGLKEGDVLYFIVKSEDATPEIPGKGSIKAEHKPVNPIVANGDPVTASLEPSIPLTDHSRSSAVWSFVTPEEGDYIVEYENGGEGLELKWSESVYELTGDDCQSFAMDWYSPASSGNIDLGRFEGGKTVFMILTNGSSDHAYENVKLTLRSKKTHLLTEAGSEDVSVDADGCVNYSYSVPKTVQSGYTIFTFTGPVGAQLTLYSGFDGYGDVLAESGNLTEDDRTFTYVLTDRELKEFTSNGFSVRSTIAGTVAGKAEEKMFTPLVIGQTAVKGAEAGDHYFCFAPDESEVYSVEVKTPGSKLRVKELGNTGVFEAFAHNIERSNVSADHGYISTRDGRVFLKVTTNTKTDLTVTVRKRDAVKLSVGQEKKVTLSENTCGAYNWFSFTSPDKDGLYTFRFETETDFGFTLKEVYLGPDISTPLEIPDIDCVNRAVRIDLLNNRDEFTAINKELIAHGTLFFRFDCNVDIPITAVVEEIPYESVTLADTKNFSLDENFGDGGIMLCIFEPPLAGNYTFMYKSATKVSEEADADSVPVKASVVGEELNESGVTDAKTGICRLYGNCMARQQYVISVATDGITDTLKKVEGSIQIIREKTEDIKDGEVKKFDLAYDGAVYNRYRLAVPEGGWYTFGASTGKFQGNAMQAHLEAKDNEDNYIYSGDIDDEVSGYFYCGSNGSADFSFNRGTVPDEALKEPVKTTLSVNRIKTGTLVKDTASPISLGKDASGWFSYTVSENGFYDITLACSSGSLSGYVLNGGSDEWGDKGTYMLQADASDDETAYYYVEKGDVIYVHVDASSAETNAGSLLVKDLKPIASFSPKGPEDSYYVWSDQYAFQNIGEYLMEVRADSSYFMDVNVKLEDNVSGTPFFDSINPYGSSFRYLKSFSVTDSGKVGKLSVSPYSMDNNFKYDVTVNLYFVTAYGK